MESLGIAVMAAPCHPSRGSAGDAFLLLDRVRTIVFQLRPPVVSVKATPTGMEVALGLRRGAPVVVAFGRNLLLVSRAAAAATAVLFKNEALDIARRSRRRLAPVDVTFGRTFFFDAGREAALDIRAAAAPAGCPVPRRFLGTDPRVGVR